MGHWIEVPSGQLGLTFMRSPWVSIETLEKLAVFFGHETVPQAWKDALFESNQTPRARSSISLDNLPPLGQAMRRQRLELGLSIREIADKMGISSVTISGYESGKKNGSSGLLGK